MMRTIRRRRREQKTDYNKRIKLLKSEKARIVFRKTNKYIIAQYVVSDEAQDKIEIGITSKELLKYGWPKSAEGSLKSIPATYLTGYLMGKKIKEKKLENPIIDFGMLRVLHKTKPYAFIKGLKDFGIEIQCKEEICPEEEKLKGENSKNKIDVEAIKTKIGK